MLVMTNKPIVNTENRRRIEASMADCIWTPSVIASSPMNKDKQKKTMTPVRINSRNLSRMASQIEYLAIVSNRL